MGLSTLRPVVAGVVVGWALLSPAVPAAAQPSDPPPGQGLTAAVLALPARSPSLDGFLAEAARAQAARDRTQTDLDATRNQLGRTVDEGVALAALAARRRGEADRLVPVAARLRADLRAITTEGFVTGFGVNDALDPTLTSAERARRANLHVLAEAALQDTLDDTRRVERRLRRLRAEADDLTDRAADADALEAALTARADRLTAGLADDEAALAAAEREVAQAKVGAVIVGTDLPVLAADAYYRAARLLSLTDPNCGVPWWALAGIGRTESNHGRYRGAGVSPDGQVEPRIYGPMLDGSGPFAVVGDTDDGALDGTAAGERAVGPMQFLPGTWRTVGRDGTFDGVADPHNLYDAALGAGALLCRSGSLSSEAALRRSFRTYNNSGEYVQVVWERGQEYAGSVPLG
ncbi:MAG: lytic transglycosylase domain-containing protein [Actinomycetes bacterium]